MKRAWSYIVPLLCTLAAVGIGATAKRSVSITNFNSGELSPLIQSRVDFPKYNSGAKTLQNMIVRSQGPASRRPGTKFIAEVKDSNDPARLISFEYSTSDAYTIELGDLYARFYRNGAPVPISGADANAYELVTPWDANDLFEIQMAQDSQYMRLVHPDYKPYKLTRNSASHADWSCTAITFSKGPFLDENDDTAITITPSAVTGDITMSSTGSSMWDADHVGALWQISHIVEANTVSGSWVLNVAYTGPSETLEVQKGRYFDFSTHGNWDGTMTLERSFDEGVSYEDVVSHTANFDGNIQYSGQETDDDALYRVAYAGYTQGTDRAYAIYNLVARSFKVNGVVSITAVVDVNDANGTVVETLGGTSATYRWAEGVWSDYRGWPRTVEHHEQRCVYGGSTSWPQAVWASVTASEDGDYDDFDEGESLADDAWTYILPGMNPIQWMQSAEYLMIGTTAGVGRLGSTDTPIDPTFPPVYRLQAKNGAAYIDSVDAEDAILYVERGEQKVREISYTYSSDKFIAPEMTILAEHITGTGITEIAFQHRPDPILWCTRDDGQLLSFTYARKQEVTAWARHVTGQNTVDLETWDDFESVAVIPGSSARADGETRVDDELWAVVKRTVDSNTVRYVEQFQSLDWGDDPNYCWFVDCAGYGTSSGGGDLAAVTRSDTYKYTYFSQNGTIWGVPVADKVLTAYLDKNGVANDVGGGIVGLPFTGHPFSAGDTVRVYGSVSNNGVFTLESGTTANELQITDSFSAETFNGTEVVFRKIEDLGASAGRMVADASGNLYFGHTWGNSTAVTKIETDGTKVYDFLTWPFAGTASTQTNGLAISSDDNYLYVQTVSPYRVIKFDLDTGLALWSTSPTKFGYNLGIDSSGNAYKAAAWPGGTTRYGNASGTETELDDMGQSPHHAIIGGLMYDVEVDNSLGIVIGGGYMYCSTGESDAVKDLMYNLGVRTFDNSAGDQIRIGSNYDSGSVTRTYIVGSEHIVVHDGYIYVFIGTSSTTTELHKLQWTGSQLNAIADVAGPNNATGIYFDLWDNLVIVNQDSSGTKEDVLHYYDTDLAYVSKLSDMIPILSSWASSVGGSWQQGNVIPNGGLGDAGGEEPEEWSGQSHAEGLIECVYADGRPIGTFTVDANGTLDLGEAYDVVIAGLNYFSILETMPLQIPETMSRRAVIEKVSIDFYESMGAHVGSDMTYSSDWLFSEDEFATAIDPYTGYKGPAGFMRGMTKEPTIYIYEWDPVPMTIRSITADTKVTLE